MLDGEPYTVFDHIASRDGLSELPQVIGKTFRRHCAGIGGRDGDELLGIRGDVFIHAVEILIAQNAGEDRQLAALEIVVNILHERLNALRVVPAVDDEKRFFAHELEASRPLHRLKPRAHGLVREVPALGLERVHCRENDRRVVELVLAEKRKLQVLESSAGEDLAGKTVRLEPDGIKVRLVKRRADLLAAFFKDRLDGRLLPVDDSVAAGLDDPGLCRCDFLQRVAQNLGVVETNVAQNGSFGRQDDVRRVKFAAHADLADHDVAFFALEVFKAQRRDHLKLGRLLENRVRHGLNILGQFADGLVGDLLAVYLNALVEAENVGGRVETCFIARGLKDRGQHRAGRALAVRARDMDKFAGALRVPHFIEQRFDALEPGNAALPADSMDIVQCLFQRHNEKLLSLKSVLARRLLRAGNGRPELCAREYLCFIQQPYDQNIEHKRHAELHRARCKLCQEERLKCVSAVDEGQGPALIEDRAQDDRGQEGKADGQRVRLLG